MRTDYHSPEFPSGCTGYQNPFEQREDPSFRGDYSVQALARNPSIRLRLGTVSTALCLNRTTAIALGLGILLVLLAPEAAGTEPLEAAEPNS